MTGRGFLLAAVFLCLLTGAAGPADAREFWLAQEFRHFCAYPRIQKAFDYYDKGKYRQAADLLHAAVKIEPNNVQAHRALAETCLKLNDLACATQQGDTLVRLNPASPEGNIILARIATIEKRPADAVRAAEAALQLAGLTHEERTELVGILTVNLLKSKDLDQARRELLELVRLHTDPQGLKAAFDHLIDLCFISNEIAEGIQLMHEFEQRFGPADTPTRMYWSNLLAEHGHGATAYDMVASLPSSGVVLEHQVNLLEQLGRCREAADLLLKHGDPDDRRTPDYWVRVATLYQKAGDTDLEFDALSKGIQAVKDNGSLYDMAIERLIHLKAYAEAIGFLKAALSEHDTADLRMKLVTLYEKENDYKEASRSLYPLWKRFQGTASGQLKLTRHLLYLLEKDEDWDLYLKVMLAESKALATQDREQTGLPVPGDLFAGHHLHKKIQALEAAYPFPTLPKDERFAFIAGLIHLERLAHHPNRAKEMVRDLTQWKTLSPEQLEQVATLAYDLGMCNEAIVMARRLIAECPEAVHPFLIIGYCYQKQAHPGKAAPFLERAAALQPDLATPGFLVGLGALYAETGDTSQALSHWESALDQRFDPDLALRMARLYDGQHDVEKARDLLSRIDPDAFDRKKQADFWALRGTVAEQTGDLDGAAEDYRKSLAQWETAQVWGQLGYTCIRQGNKTSAIEAFQQALILEPDKGDYRASLAYLLAEAGRPAEAAEAFREAIRTDPENISLYEGLGYAEIGADNHTAATEAFKHVLDVYAERPPSDDPEMIKKIYAIKQTIDNIDQQWHVNFAEVIRLDNSRFGPQPSLVANTSYSGFGILSADYRAVRGLGSQNTDISLFGRFLWANKNRSLSVERDLSQAGLGLSVKPFGNYDLHLSMERLFQVGSDTQNDWMARASASFSKGGYWRPTDASWNYYDIYLDAAYLLKSGQHYLTSNLNWGRAYKVRDAWALVPYLTCGAVDSDGNTWIDAGAGIAMAIWAFQGRYHAHRLQTRITLEGRQQLAGSSKDKHTVRLKYEMRY